MMRIYAGGALVTVFIIIAFIMKKNKYKNKNNTFLSDITKLSESSTSETFLFEETWGQFEIIDE